MPLADFLLKGGNNMMELIALKIVGILQFAANNPVYIGGIVLAGILFTINLKFVQVRYFLLGWKLMFKKSNNEEDGVSPFKAAALSVGSRVGTGNIAGVTTAILMGGPGAIFWMWIIAFGGMAMAFTETTLGQFYKEKTDEHIYVGGPAYYIEKGLGKKWKPLAIFYAVIMVISFGLFFLSLHTSAIYGATYEVLNIEQGSLLSNVVTLLMLLLVASAVFGGMKVLMNIMAGIVPFMTIGYFLVVMFIIFTNLEFVPKFFELIFTYAFTPNAIAGATLGSIISIGAKRGIFSNEAGQGSGAIAGATSEVDHPVEQSFVQMNTIFIDTFIVCTLTAFVVLLGTYNQGVFSLKGANMDVLTAMQNGESAMIVTKLFDSEVGYGGIILAIFLFFFAFSSLLGNMSYGMQSVKYLFKNKTKKIQKIVSVLYGIIVLIFIIGTPQLIEFGNNNPEFNLFDIADSLASGLFYANVIAMVILFPKVKKLLKEYEITKRKK